VSDRIADLMLSEIREVTLPAVPRIGVLMQCMDPSPLREMYGILRQVYGHAVTHLEKLEA
jgi:hypothetical protein